MVGVLVLVNEHMAETPTIEVHHLWVLGEDAHDLTNEIIEVHGVGRAQAALILGEDLRDCCIERVLRLRGLRERLLRTDELILVI